MGYELVNKKIKTHDEEKDEQFNHLDPPIKTCCCCFPVKCGLCLLGFIQILICVYIGIELFVTSMPTKTVFDKHSY